MHFEKVCLDKFGLDYLWYIKSWSFAFLQAETVHAITEETRVEGNVSSQIYVRYFTAGCSHLALLTLVLLSIIAEVSHCSRATAMMWMCWCKFVLFLLFLSTGCIYRTGLVARVLVRVFPMWREHIFLQLLTCLTMFYNNVVLWDIMKWFICVCWISRSNGQFFNSSSTIVHSRNGINVTLSREDMDLNFYLGIYTGESTITCTATQF